VVRHTLQQATWVPFRGFETSGPRAGPMVMGYECVFPSPGPGISFWAEAADFRTFATFCSLTMKVLQPLIRGSLVVRSLISGRTKTDVGVCTSALSKMLPRLDPGLRRLFLLRHGETDWNTRGLMQGGGFDVELNGAGKRQAELAADHLPKVPFGVVASSHLARSSETADAIASKFPDAIRIVSPKLGEMRFGEFEGLPVRGPETTEETQEKFMSYRSIMQNNKSVPWPGGGECIADVEIRAQRGVQQLLRDYPHCDHLCVVSHGRINKILISSLLGFHEHELAAQGNTCINVLDVNQAGEWEARLINYVDHIDGGVADSSFA